MNNRIFIELLHQWREGSISKEDAGKLMEAIRSSEYDGLLDDTLQGHWDAGNLSGIVPVEGKAEVLNNLQQHITRPAAVIKTVHRVHFLRTSWFRWAAAVIIIFGTATYIFTHTSQPDKEVVIDQPSPKSNDILPGFNRAILTLSDGKKVELDSAASETISDGNLEIQNNNGQLVYYSATKSGNPVNPGNPRLNTMATPKGGQYQLTLADGTRVWLNAASSITYPTTFTGKTREVYISGEAYFEVKANKTNPFIVKTNKETITVLGTSFNVNVYDDEDQMKTSLLEGSVKVGEKLLQPGQAYKNGKIISTQIDQDIAWKNGYFSFSHNDVPYLMRQISRWYNINVKYAPGFHNQFITGKMERNLKLSEVMDILEAMGVKYRKENNSVIIE